MAMRYMVAIGLVVVEVAHRPVVWMVTHKAACRGRYRVLHLM